MSAEETPTTEQEHRITLRAILAGTVLAAVFAGLTVYFENRAAIFLTSTQIAVLPFILVFLGVTLLNPLLRVIRVIRPFTTAEVLIIFIMGAVSAGISTFSMASQLVPVVGSLYNENFAIRNKWDVHVSPNIDDSYFVAAPGIREASAKYRDALHEHDQLRSVYRVASSVVKTERAAEARRKELAEAEAATYGEETEKIARLTAAKRALQHAERAAEQARRAWDRMYAETHDPEEVFETYPPRIEKAREERDAARKALTEVERDAFDKVAVFRNGLPEDERALPGFIKSADETWENYFARIDRFTAAWSARAEAAEALSLLEQSSPDVSGAAARLQTAASELEPVAETAPLEERLDALSARMDELDAEWKRHAADLKRYSQERRMAPPEEHKRLDTLKEDVRDLQQEVDEERTTVEADREAVRELLAVTEKVSNAASTLEAIRTSLETTDTPIDEVTPKLAATIDEFNAFDGTARRFLIGDIPWSQWTGPIGKWILVILLTYVVLMTFNVLIFRQWAHNEKLSYPLAQLPELMSGVQDEGAREAAETVPPLYRRGLFWGGFAIVAFIQGWNLFATSGIIQGLGTIGLRADWTPFIENSIFEGLVPHARFEIFFTMIGLSFLLPAKISFSMWFFYCLYMFQLLVMVWLGHGVNAKSFPVEWWSTLNFRFAEAGGALLVFAGVVLWKCRKYILCLFTPSSVEMLEPGERTELRVSSFIFLAGSVALMLIVWLDMGANPWYTLFYFAVMLVITIGLVRAVAEGGILGFQCWFGPFHIIRSVFGMGRSWTMPSLFTPLIIYHSILFLDIKTFIAPAMANCLKIKEDLRMSRMRFHLSVVIGILIAVVVAVVAHLILAYSLGGDKMQHWFYTALPKQIFNKTAEMGRLAPTDRGADPLWIGFGAALMGALLYARQFLFWLPHPIGLIMLVSPLMSAYWFSIFTGWISKHMVTEYGNKETYRSGRAFFVGLIVGELVCIAAAMIIGYMTGHGAGISLNRNQ